MPIPAPTSQKAGVRPIYFMLDNAGALGAPVFLTIRPEDLTRSEPTRAAVHQTLGRDVQGWVDHFGRGLPSVNISGHTGWRHLPGTGMDGSQAFEALNRLVTHEYAEAKQAAVDAGADPGLVRLLFVDTLDQFAYAVVPMQFTLRRSKSRPLLFQYSISMQATSDAVEVPVVAAPFTPNFSAAMDGVDANIEFFSSNSQNFEPWFRDLITPIDTGRLGLASSLSGYASIVAGVLSMIRSRVSGEADLSRPGVQKMISLAQQLSSSGANVVGAINGLSDDAGVTKVRASSVFSAYNEVRCLLSNALRPRQLYEDYSPLYGASNCSSTTGGRPPSELLGVNVFAEMMSDSDAAIDVSGDAVSALRLLSGMDPILSPMPLPEIERLVDNVVSGVSA